MKNPGQNEISPSERFRTLWRNKTLIPLEHLSSPLCQMMSFQALQSSTATPKIICDSWVPLAQYSAATVAALNPRDLHRSSHAGRCRLPGGLHHVTHLRCLVGLKVASWDGLFDDVLVHWTEKMMLIHVCLLQFSCLSLRKLQYLHYIHCHACQHLCHLSPNHCNEGSFIWKVGNE